MSRTPSTERTISVGKLYDPFERTEAEVASYFPAVMSKLGSGAKIVVGREHKPESVIRPATPSPKRVTFKIISH